MASKETEYAEQLKSLGIYDKAFEPAIHELCILERELSRARKQLKDKAGKDENGKPKAPSYSDPLYASIRQIQTSILAYRDSLGLTPKSLKKLKGALSAEPAEAPQDNVLTLILNRHDRKSDTTA